ncbi:unnamed protein product, partial [Medioppia subpectinata]
KNSGVECRFCGNRQLRNSAKCRRHTYICGECPEEIKQTLYYEGTKPTARKTSDVWRHWKHVSGIGDKAVVECMYCGHKLQKHAPKCRQHLWKCPKCPTNVMGSDMESSDNGSDSCGGGPDLGGDSDSGDHQPIEPIVSKYRPQVYETVDIWRHWKHVSGSGAKSIVECMYCGHKLQKHAPKCRRHIMKCPKNVKHMVTNDNDLDSCGGGPGFGGDSYSGADQPIEPIVPKYRPRVFRPVDIWRHWKHVSGSGSKSVVECMYCGNKQQKHAPKCRRHLMKCPKNPKNMDNSDNDSDSFGSGPAFGGDSDSGADQPIEPIVRQYRPRVCKSVEIHDLLDELSDENKRLLDELKFAQKYIEFMQNYRKCVLVYKRKCVCVHTIDHKPIVQRLETRYDDIKTQIQRMRIQSDADCSDSEVKSVAKRKQNNSLIALINAFNPSVNSVTINDNQSSGGEDSGDDYNPIADDFELNYYPVLEPNNKKSTNTVGKQSTHRSAHTSGRLTPSGQTKGKDTFYQYRKADGKIKCQWTGCRLYFVKPNHMWRHYRSKHTTIRPFKCPQCPKAFAFNDGLRQHLIVCHNSGATDGNQWDRKAVDETDEQSHECCINDCERVFDDKESLDKHMRDDHNYRPVTREDILLKKGIRPVTREDILLKKGIRCDWPDCEVVCQTSRSLEMHRYRAHTKTKSLVCGECGSCFGTKHCLNNHKKRCTSLLKYRRYKGGPAADDTDDELSPSAAKRQRTAIDEIFWCQYPNCGREYSTQSELKTHIGEQHNTGGQYKCQKCDMSFDGRYNLRKHEIQTHETVYEEEEEEAMSGEEIAEDGHPIYACDWVGCDDRFRIVKKLQHHYRTVHNSDYALKCHKCDKRFRERHKLRKHKIIYHSTGAPKMPYQCAYEGCGQGFIENFQLVAHTRKEHTLEQPYECQQCDRRFVLEVYLTRHVAHNHSKAYGCEACDQTFDTKTALNGHHSENPDHLQHRCDRCAKKFNTNDILIQHYNEKHVMERKFKCPEPDCDRQYISYRLLRKHMVVHRGVRSHVCEWPGCEKAFFTSTNLKVHRDMHTDVRNFRCEYQFCGKTFRKRVTRDTHMATHQAIKKFGCCWPGCEETFVMRVAIDAHIYEHQGLKPYRCQMDGCKIACRRQNSLKRHYTNIHHRNDIVVKNLTKQYPTDQYIMINSDL